jgi:hypothetical protein
MLGFFPPITSFPILFQAVSSALNPAVRNCRCFIFIFLVFRLQNGPYVICHMISRGSMKYNAICFYFFLTAYIRTYV